MNPLRNSRYCLTYSFVKPCLTSQTDLMPNAGHVFALFLGDFKGVGYTSHTHACVRMWRTLAVNVLHAVSLARVDDGLRKLAPSITQAGETRLQ
jgi:hypothetical protein